MNSSCSTSRVPGRDFCQISRARVNKAWSNEKQDVPFKTNTDTLSQSDCPLCSCAGDMDYKGCVHSLLKENYKRHYLPKRFHS